MDKKDTFEKNILKIALPVTLQSLLQSSFGIVDQVMIGQLGSSSIAGIGLGGKFISLYSVILAAIAGAAGIMISQYMGRNDEKAAGRSFFASLALSAGLAVVFMACCMVFPQAIMGIYTKDTATRDLAAGYIRILAFSFLPMAVSSIVTTMLRCMNAASLPLYASLFALFLNTGLNYLLIFGRWMFPKLGVEGAALASMLSQLVSCAVILFLFWKHRCRRTAGMSAGGQRTVIHQREYWGQFAKILCPMLICEFLWSLGENVYTVIYGNMGTDACAAMTITTPVQSLTIGALSGLSQASGILIGKFLGAEEYEKAYAQSKKLMKYGFAGSLILSVILAAASSWYVKLYNVEPPVREAGRNLLIAFAVISPVKVQNMILGGGIIRSGGKTKYIMWVDFIGTWLLGVPLGLLSAFIWKLDISLVYFILSLEECVRFGITLALFKRKTWMESLR